MKNNADTLMRSIWRLFPHSTAEHLSEGSWSPYDYLVKISEHLAETIALGGGRVIICVPPRHGKSELISKWTPIWFLENFPDKHVILVSYATEFAVGWGRKVRNLIQEKMDQLSVRVSDDSSSASRWHTTAGGSMTCLGVDASITGRGGDLIILDDPIKNHIEYQSVIQREHLQEWFRSVLMSRLEPQGTVAIITTRWGERDLVGFLLSEPDNGWAVISLPALAGKNDFLGRTPGQALCPQRYDVADLLKIQKIQGAALFSCMYQQSPESAEGNLFKKTWWNFYTQKDIPSFSEVIQSWDTGFGQGKDSSFSVCQTWGLAENGFYLIDQIRVKLEFPDLVRAVETQAERHQPALVLIEYQASGRPLAQVLRRKTRLPIKMINVANLTKLQRAELITHIVENGRVWLPKAEWTATLLHELSVLRMAGLMTWLTACLRHYRIWSTGAGEDKGPPLEGQGQEEHLDPGEIKIIEAH